MFMVDTLECTVNTSIFSCQPICYSKPIFSDGLPVLCLVIYVLCGPLFAVLTRIIPTCLSAFWQNFLEVRNVWSNNAHQMTFEVRPETVSVIGTTPGKDDLCVSRVRRPRRTSAAARDKNREGDITSFMPVKCNNKNVEI
ncbi:hypothetical protein GALMADRAFT_245268, partial [Galerina marginata CBS 339.88]